MLPWQHFPLTAVVDRPLPYGRIIRDSANGIVDIVEEDEASAEVRRICEVNVGAYAVEAAAIFGAVMLHLDYTVPVSALRAKLEEIAKASKLWDGRVVNLQVSDARAPSTRVTTER